MTRALQSYRSSIRVGTPVEVSTRFLDTWVHGFEIASTGEVTCRLRRISDGELLPAEFEYWRIRIASR